jgi:hypothetical protein
VAVVVVTGTYFAVDLVQYYSDQVRSQAVKRVDYCAQGFAAGVSGARYYDDSIDGGCHLERLGET